MFIFQISTVTTNHHLLNHQRSCIEDQQLTYQQTHKRKKRYKIVNCSLRVSSLSSLLSLLLLVLLSLINLSLASLPCSHDEYWDPKLDSCLQCSRCDDDQMIVIRPCQPHLDTKCGTINDLELDWSYLQRIESRKVSLK